MLTAQSIAAQGQTIHVWIDHTYYDGLWSFAQGVRTGDSPVEWCGQPLPRIRPTCG